MTMPTNDRHQLASRPSAGYVAVKGGPLDVDRPRYEHISTDLPRRQLVDSFVIPVRDGRSWEVPAGHLCAFVVLEGPQVLDLNLWSAADHRERFWAARTRQFYGTHLTVGHQLWSSLPFLRPLATIVTDTIDYGRDEDGAGCNDLLGTRCDPYVTELLSGVAYDFNCHANLVRAAQTRGLTEFDIHDVINVFQVTGLMPDDGRYFMKPSPARPGDRFEILAETDLLLAASTCPGGDLAVPMWGPGSGQEPNCNPIGVEVYRLDAELLAGWSPSQPSARPMVGHERPPVDLSSPRPSLDQARPLASIPERAAAVTTAGR